MSSADANFRAISRARTPGQSPLEAIGSPS
jgi:hypothetical protein